MTLPPRARSEFFAPNSLSIVVQGGLFASNITETANHCAHWRELFPCAEIILSLSSTDIVTGRLTRGRLTQITAAPPFALDSMYVAAIESLVANCDKILLCREGLLLPPIKSDTPRPNSINLQISAAQNGLKHATGTYVLRIRSDIVFLTADFIDQYLVGAALPRGDAAVLSTRVLISWLYTLNPYTWERLPLHLSDWFNFGLLVDVRKLWNIPLMSLKDAVYYKVNPFALYSNVAERLFNIRLADEQHIAFNALHKLLPEITLDYHNDHSSLKRCVDATVDNFTLCDLVSAKCIFEKYSFDFDNYDKTFHCITPEQWRRMVENRYVDYRITLADVIEESIDRRAYQMEQSFPRIYNAAQLSTRSGRKINGVIVGEGNGVLCYGPHVIMPQGHYRACVDAFALFGQGEITITASLNQGAIILASRTIHFDAATAPTELNLPFEVSVPFGSDFEIVCETRGVRQATIRQISIARAPPDLAAMPVAHKFPPDRLLAFNGAKRADGVVSLASHGLLSTSPYFELAQGSYAALLTFIADPETTGSLTIAVSAEFGRIRLAEQTISMPMAVSDQRIGFVVPDGGMLGMKVECTLANASTITLASVVIEPDSDAPVASNPVVQLRRLMAKVVAMC